jgi:hypothetical protein
MAMVIEALSGPRPSARDEGPERAVAFAGLSTRADASRLPIALRSAITNGSEIAAGARPKMLPRGDFGGEPAFAPPQGFTAPPSSVRLALAGHALLTLAKSITY